MRRALLISAFFACLASLHAQLNYSFSAVSGSYTSNSSPTNLHGSNIDDALSSSTAIGFTFQYGCTNYTQFKASSNGVMFLGTAAGASNAFNDLDGSSDRLALAPLWDDMATDGSGSVNYKLTGTSPNRVLTVEWKQMLWTYSASTWAISFQVKLYETTNVIEFVYSRNGTAGGNVSSGASASIGISGTALTDFYSLNGVGASPTAVYGTETSNLSTKPASGQVYRFTPVQCSGTPAGGTTAATATTGCSGYTSVLSLSGQTTGCGITYQWQSSANGSTWSNVTGATSSTYTATVSSTIYYKCIVSCSNSGLSAPSSTVQLTVTPNCYTMSNTAVNIASCPFSGSFYDSGGSGSDYTDGETYTKTFTAPAGSCLSFSFSAFATESCCDELTIYDGPNTSSPVIGTYAGTTSPGSFSSSGTSVTFAWSSDFSTTDAGWVATFSCAPSCSGAPTAGTATASPTALTCGSSTTALSLSGNASGCGITFQWQSSPNNSTWTNISGATSSTYTATLNATTYYRCLVSCGGSSSPSSSIQVTFPSGPSNDNCSGATSITVGGSCVAGDVTCASQSQAGCTGTANDDVWYSFVANSSSLNITVSASSSFDPVVQLFSGACGSLTSVLCEDATFTTGGASKCKNATGLTVGNTYYIRVYDYYSGYPSTKTFTLCVAQPAVGTYTCNLNYSTSTISNVQDNGVNTSVAVSDDRLSNSISLPFTFCFDGYQYTKVYVSSNASLVFDAVDGCVPNVYQSRTVAANGASTGYEIVGPAPTTTDYCPQNAILGPWHDIDPSKGGAITYATLGTSPNRRFIVFFDGVKQYYSTSPCQNASYDYTGQIKLYETSNNIEIHIDQMNSCTGWNEGQAILGLHNAFGSLAVVPAGYNANASSPFNVYSITNKAWRFTPNCSGCSVILPVEMTQFNAFRKDETRNELQWSTASENQVKWFHVERSADGINFTNVAKQPAKNALGADYAYLDVIDDSYQTYYYRIATEDMDGSIEYSGLRVVQRDRSTVTTVMKVYPNPFTNSIFIEMESLGEHEVQVEVMDMVGKKVYASRITLADGSNTIKVSDIESGKGLYLVRVSDAQGNLILAKKILRN
jgi:hypothetical protein